ncbi:MAG: hypothetical protein LAT84_04300 [Balneolia bacterium]|nr:hypothetical protein [Balneolia bacterium]
MTDLFTISLLVSVAACGYMTGLVVFVHLVHYPGFYYVDKSRGQAFHNFHTTNTGYAVGLPMIAELAAAVGLLIFAPDSTMLVWAAIAAFLLLLVWLETGLRVIPVHNRLAGGEMKNDDTILKLVQSNRNRTFIWSLRFLILLFMIKLLL